MVRIIVRGALGLGLLLAGLAIAGAIYLTSSTFGGTVSGARLVRAEQSPEWRDGHFENDVATRLIVGSGYWHAITAYFRDAEARRPGESLAVTAGEPSAFAGADGGEVVWLGHSTVLLRMDSTVVLTDPVFDDALAISMGLRQTARFFPSPIRREELPVIDAVLISHDHFDHLEESTVRFFSGTGTKYIVPLGVGAHLEAWGMSESQITELDWGDSVRVGNVWLHCAPARHFSGRSPLSRNQTLWSSWVIAGQSSRVFYSGDTGPGTHFAKIGEHYGPFALTLMQIGAYGDDWPDIHLTPEQAALAQQQLRGSRLLPMHWGTFDLALHPWAEPIERLQAAARKAGIGVITPRLGERVRTDRVGPQSSWWRAGEDGASDDPL